MPEIERVPREQLLEEGRKQARIHGVDMACAPLYAEGWAAAARLAIDQASQPLKTVQLLGYGYEWRDPRDGSIHRLNPKDVTVILPSTRHMDDFDLHNSLHLAEEKLAVLERRIARVRQMCDLMVRVKDAQAILEVLDGVEDEKPPAVPPGERCNHVYAYTAADVPAQVIVQCGLRRHGSYGPHVGSYRGESVTWTGADHREDKADG